MTQTGNWQAQDKGSEKAGGGLHPLRGTLRPQIALGCAPGGAHPSQVVNASQHKYLGADYLQLQLVTDGLRLSQGLDKERGG